jgi:hypothetical protein
VNFSICSSREWSFVFGLLLAPAVLLAVTLVQENPPVRPADADSPVAMDLKAHVE